MILIAVIALFAAALLGAVAHLIDKTADTVHSLETALWGTSDPQLVAARRADHNTAATTKEN